MTETIRRAQSEVRKLRILALHSLSVNFLLDLLLGPPPQVGRHAPYNDASRRCRQT